MDAVSEGERRVGAMVGGRVWKRSGCFASSLNLLAILAYVIRELEEKEERRLTQF